MVCSQNVSIIVRTLLWYSVGFVFCHSSVSFSYDCFLDLSPCSSRMLVEFHVEIFLILHGSLQRVFSITVTNSRVVVDHPCPSSAWSRNIRSERLLGVHWRWVTSATARDFDGYCARDCWHAAGAVRKWNSMFERAWGLCALVTEWDRGNVHRKTNFSSFLLYIGFLFRLTFTVAYDSIEFKVRRTVELWLSEHRLMQWSDYRRNIILIFY